MGVTWPSTQGQEEVGILWGMVKWGRGEVRGALVKDGWGRELRGPLYLISFKNNRGACGILRQVRKTRNVAYHPRRWVQTPVVTFSWAALTPSDHKGRSNQPN